MSQEPKQSIDAEIELRSKLASIITDSHTSPLGRLEQAHDAIKAYIAWVIGEDDKQTPNDEDFSDWTVCENCDVILNDLTAPAFACICTRRNQLRKEQRQRAGLQAQTPDTTNEKKEG